MATPKRKAPVGKRLVIVRSFRHHRTGKLIVAAPGKFFAFYVDA